MEIREKQTHSSWTVVMGGALRSGFTLTYVSCLASDSQVDVALLGCLLHELDHKLVGFAHDCRPVHANQLVPGAQAPVFVCSAVLHDVADVDLKIRGVCCFFSGLQNVHYRV